MTRRIRIRFINTDIKDEWLSENGWVKNREQAMTFESIDEAEALLRKTQIGWEGKVMFDVEPEEEK